MKIRVKQGCIHVNSVRYLARNADSFVLSVDARAKYYRAYPTGMCEVALDSGENTVAAEDTDDPTLIEIEIPGKWHITANAARYSAYIYGVRRPDEPPTDGELWTDEMEESDGR